MRTTGLFIAIVLLMFPELTLSQQEDVNLTVKIQYKSKSYIGRPLAWDGKDMVLLRRDGKISTLPVKSNEDYKPVRRGFDPLSSTQLRKRLQKEFGSKYQISVTDNFVVVHPPGDYVVWAMPFQKLYSRFEVYFSSRGIPLEEPEFPMVAVVLRTRGEFDRFLKAYHTYNRNVLGYYSTMSNRIITYDQTEGKSNSQSWFFNADTIIHEATHQTAYNTGIHSRYSPVSRWVSEGLAMLFEAPGVNNSMYFTRQSDRINRDRLIALKRFCKQGKVDGKISKLVLSDDLFRSDGQLAYALSWGMTFYLTEKMPEQYREFLRRDGQRTEFANYTSQQRANDFAAAFGNDLSGLESRMKRFFNEIKVPSK